MTDFWRAAAAGGALLGMLPMVQPYQSSPVDGHVVAWAGHYAAWLPAEPHVWTLATDGRPEWPGNWRRADDFRWTTEAPVTQTRG
jgi:hypothetical protein